MNPLVSQRLQFFSPHSPAECADQLERVIDRSFSPFGTKPVRGRVSETYLSLRKRSIRGANAFQRSLRATVRPEGGGSMIEGRMLMNPFVFVFLVIWLVPFVLVGCSGLSSMVGAIFRRDLGGLLSGATLSGISALMIADASWMAGFWGSTRQETLDETRYLVRFLARWLDTEVIDLAPAADADKPAGQGSITTR